LDSLAVRYRPDPGFQPPELFGAYLFRVAPFRDSGIASSSVDVRGVFFFPSNFARQALYFTKN
jgi:hypothetical protein